MDSVPKRKPKIRKPQKLPKLFVEEVSARNSETGYDELYLVADGQRIAKRGYSDTLQAMTWIVTAIGRSMGFSFDVPDDGGGPVLDAGEVQLMPEPKGAMQCAADRHRAEPNARSARAQVHRH
jgi:hypothetical protein